MTEGIKAAETVVYQGKILEVVQQQIQTGEREITIEFARRAPGTRLIIPTPNGNLLMTKEYRRELNGWDYRLPGGKVFDRLTDYNQALAANEDMIKLAETAAKKEALEEVGIDVEDLTHFATSKCGATVEWDLLYFVVNRYQERSSGQELEHGEVISVEELSLDEVKRLCLEGGMQEERSAAILLRYLHQQNNF